MRATITYWNIKVVVISSQIQPMRFVEDIVIQQGFMICLPFFYVLLTAKKFVFCVRQVSAGNDLKGISAITYVEGLQLLNDSYDLWLKNVECLTAELAEIADSRWIFKLGDVQVTDVQEVEQIRWIIV